MNRNPLPIEYVNKIIKTSLEEDTGRGDITSKTLIPCDLQGKACMLIKGDGVIAGTELAEGVFHLVDPSLKIEILIKDGTPVKIGDIAMTISGNVRSILQAERVALNFLQRLSGIASTTASYVARVHDLGVDIADTREDNSRLKTFREICC